MPGKNSRRLQPRSSAASQRTTMLPTSAYFARAVAPAGQGLLAAAKDNYPRDGATFSYIASFAEVEVDVETGKYNIVDFLAYADVGSVIHPRSLGGQVLGRSILGIGHAIGQKWVYGHHYGAMLS